jgi:phospholipase/carboxylesterase
VRRPDVLHKAVLLSPMLPFEPKALPDLRAVAVFIGAGLADPLVPADQAHALSNLLQKAGAAVTLHWTPDGHSLTEDEIRAARNWISQRAIS